MTSIIQNAYCHVYAASLFISNGSQQYYLFNRKFVVFYEKIGLFVLTKNKLILINWRVIALTGKKLNHN